eukprot:scaffold219866_cov31-Prasinocladus_malaysianus.AAC.2
MSSSSSSTPPSSLAASTPTPQQYHLRRAREMAEADGLLKVTIEVPSDVLELDVMARLKDRYLSFGVSEVCQQWNNLREKRWGLICHASSDKLVNKWAAESQTGYQIDGYEKYTAGNVEGAME